MTSTESPSRPLRRAAVLGAGPIGLDAALALTGNGWDVTVYEAGDAVADHVRAWGHVRLFTPWSMNASRRMREHLVRAGHPVPDEDSCPTGHELAERLLEPVAALPVLRGRIRLGHRAVAVARDGLLKHEQIGTEKRARRRFRLLLDAGSDEHEAYADLVLDCTGSYGTPNTIGDGGIPAPGERTLADRVVRTLPDTRDPGAWEGSVLLVGAGKSAQTAARDLAALPATRLHWAVRDPGPDWGVIHADTLPGRQELVDTSRALAVGANPRVTVYTGSRVVGLHDDGDRRIRVRLTTGAGPAELTVDHLVALTGYVGDHSLYRQLQVHECYATGAPMNLSAALLGSATADCLAQPAVGAEALANPEPDFYILGAKSYGRLNTFLLRTGYQQVDQITARYQTTSSTG